MYGFLDRFLWKVFSIAKIISAIVVSICLIIATFAGIGLLFGGGKSFETPEFFSFKEQLETQTTQYKYSRNYEELNAKRKIEKEYGEDIKGIVKKFNLPSNAYDVLIKELINIKEEYRDEFIKGLEDYLEDAEDYIEKEGKKAKITIVDAVNQYLWEFEKEIQKVEMSQATASMQKVYSLSILGGSLLIMLGFLIVPLLIQIERNTRKEI